jgi:hypothetical protein
VYLFESANGVLTFPDGEIMVAAMKTKNALSFEETHTFVDNVFGQDMHAKRVLSLSNACAPQKGDYASAGTNEYS